MRDDESAGERPDESGRRESAGDIALHLGALGRRVEIADHGLRHNRERDATETLHNAKRDERRHAPGETAQQRAEHEEEKAEIEYALAAIEIAEPAVDRHGD